MVSARIFVAMNNEISVDKLNAILTESGYIVIGQAKEGQECLRKIRSLRPEIVILDYNIHSCSGREVAQIAIEDKICDVILLITEAQKDLIIDMDELPGFVSMTKPINRIALINSIDLMFKSNKKIRRLEKEIGDLKAILDTRKEVDKAKGILMKNLNISEADAYKKIQKQSMDKGITMKEIAKAIILASDI